MSSFRPWVRSALEEVMVWRWRPWRPDRRGPPDDDEWTRGVRWSADAGCARLVRPRRLELGGPDTSAQLADADHDLVSRHGDVRSTRREVGHRVLPAVCVKHRDGIARRPLGLGIEALSPEAVVAIALGHVVQLEAVPRPSRRIGQGAPVR